MPPLENRVRIWLRSSIISHELTATTPALIGISSGLVAIHVRNVYLARAPFSAAETRSRHGSEMIFSLAHVTSPPAARNKLPEGLDVLEFVRNLGAESLHLDRCEAISFANLKALVPDLALGCDFLVALH
jgi:hypothetical protein